MSFRGAATRRTRNLAGMPRLKHACARAVASADAGETPAVHIAPQIQSIPQVPPLPALKTKACTKIYPTPPNPEYTSPIAFAWRAVGTLFKPMRMARW